MGNPSRREQIEQMLADEPGDSFLRYCLAMEYKTEGNHEQAAACFRELIRLSADYVPAYLQLGQLLTQLGREDEAKAVYKDGIVMAERKGDQHAAGEMANFLAMLE